MDMRQQGIIMAMTLKEVQVGTDPPVKCWIAKIEQPPTDPDTLGARSKFADGYD